MPDKEYISFLKELEGKKLIIVLKSGYTYKTEDFKVLNDQNASFTDIFGSHNFISISQISQLKEDMRKI